MKFKQILNKMVMLKLLYFLPLHRTLKSTNTIHFSFYLLFNTRRTRKIKIKNRSGTRALRIPYDCRKFKE